MTTAEINSTRTARLYTLGEAARLARVTPATINRWLYGSEHTGPVLNYGSDRNRLVVSFIELIELSVAMSFRRRKVTVQRIHLGHKYAREKLGIEYPFAWMKLADLGGRILREFDEKTPGAPLVELSAGQQATLPGIVTAQLQTVEFAEDGYASRWFPMGRDVPIVIDPKVSAGAPVVQGRRLTVQAIYKRRKAGFSLARISEDLSLVIEDVDKILLYADKVRMAA